MNRKSGAAKGSLLEKKLSMRKRSVFERKGPLPEKEMDALAGDYMDFLSTAKTEREACGFLVKMLEKAGFQLLDDTRGRGRPAAFKPGNRYYMVNRGKAISAFVIGTEPLESGLNLIVAHLDSPRLDLKQRPLYEDKDTTLSLLRTHYYGGLRKHQWASIPLALHGVVVREDGSVVDINIGEDPSDPVLTIPDLLPHLSRKKQNRRKLPDGIRGEELRALAGSIPAKGRDKDAVKWALLELLNERYGMVEEDLASAELELMPAGRARYVGFDRMLIGSWGQDDKVSAYASVRALMKVREPARSCGIFLFDKEEIGSEGPTGARSAFVPNSVSRLLIRGKVEQPDRVLRKALAHSLCLSTDVKSAINPIFPTVQEASNAAKLHHGITLTKYTGARGKSAANDASAEFVGKVRRLFNENDILWQPQESGKVDEGGGGTVAKFLAVHDMDVLDSGVPILAMHSTFEVISKADLREAVKAYEVFLGKLTRG